MPPWKTVAGDALGFALAVWAIPLAILVVGTPIAMAAALVLMLARWASG